jgi:alkanesulfonate monooxygenase SsuD/methylene tetrahydromethanopterin reductase-like flavin-dependent oxidoreductase (luciferase family)
VLPLHDPVEVAEQAAIVDQLTSGHFILGVGLGDSPAEFAAFRVPANRRGARFEEQLSIIRALWRGETVSHKGRFYYLNEVKLETKPEQPGGPPIWIGGWGPRQLERAASIGDAWFPGPVGTMNDVTGLLSRYDRDLLEKGEDPLSRSRPITRDVIIATDGALAWELADRSVLRRYREEYVEANHPLVGKRSGVAFADLKDLARDRLIIGDPHDVAAQIARCIVQLRANHVILRLKLPGVEPSDITRMLQILGRDVLPRLREACENETSLKQLAALAPE